MPSTQPISPTFIEKQRKRLEALRDDLTASDTDATDAEVDDEATRGAEAQESEDAAQALERKEVLQAKHEVDQGRLALLERALRKIELGTYGLSEVSGKPIPLARLEAVPEAVMTLEEAAANEATHAGSA